MTKEIGSEFHRIVNDSSHGLTCPVLGLLVFSGRTAIETVLKEIPNAKKALLPSYCCDSMIEPFRRVGIHVEFFPVRYNGKLVIELDIPQDVDIILWCNYFGFKTVMPDMSDFLNRGGVIIEDITHSFFSDQSYHKQSTYLVASLRKWEPINCGGYCASVSGELNHTSDIEPPQEFIAQKTKAMYMKAEYLKDFDEARKTEFLQLFGECNHWLADNYSNLSIDTWSREYLSKVDMEKQRQIRRNNARALYAGLTNAQFLFPEEDMDCPLFVPILLQNRDALRRVLTENQIYCPVHWPKPEGAESNLYGTELSLICDQRYNKEDMERIISVIKSLI